MPALDTKIVVCGETLWIRRSFDLIKRLEQKFGPLGMVLQSARSMSMPHETLRDVLIEMLKSSVDKTEIDSEAIEDWMFDVGMIDAPKPAIEVLAMLFAGNKKAQEVVKEDDTNPPQTPQTDSSLGVTS